MGKSLSFNNCQSWALEVFLNFSIIKNDFLHFFNQGFSNITGAEIGYREVDLKEITTF